MLNFDKKREAIMRKMEQQLAALDAQEKEKKAKVVGPFAEKVALAAESAARAFAEDNMEIVSKMSVRRTRLEEAFIEAITQFVRADNEGADQAKPASDAATDGAPISTPVVSPVVSPVVNNDADHRG